MKKGKQIFWIFAGLLILFRVAWSLPVGEWVSSSFSFSRIGMLLILLLNIGFWFAVIRYLKKNNHKKH